MKKMLIIALLFVGCEKKVSIISADCSVNGYGQATCDFENNGNAKGSGCVTITFKRTHSKSEYKEGFYGGAGSIISNKQKPFCSGLIEPMDVKQRVKKLTFMHDYGSINPKEFCQIRGEYQLYLEDFVYDGSWYDGCIMTTSDVEQKDL